jgi:hypothetical protein
VYECQYTVFGRPKILERKLNRKRIAELSGGKYEKRVQFNYGGETEVGVASVGP